MEPNPKFLGPEYADQFSDPAVAAVYRKRPSYPTELFTQLAALLPDSNRSLLDVGAGTGEIAIPMSSYAEVVDAVEPSAAMLQIARQQPLSHQVSWHNMSGEDFGYPAQYGLITCAQCLGWMDWEIVFPSFATALSADGWLVVVEQDALTDLPCQQELTRLISHYSTNQDFNYKGDQGETQETLPSGKQKLYVSLDKKNRKGKAVTLVEGFVGSDEDLKELGKELKSKCGSGGTAKEGEIMVQGDFRDRIVSMLNDKGYLVKRKGG